MSKTTSRDIHRGDELTIQATGERVYVVGVDSDPACAVWVCFLADTDRDAHVMRSELVVA